MANHKGSEGAVYIGANQVAEVLSWSFEQSADLIEDTILSETARTFQSGRTTATGEFECHWDETDTNGQGALTIGASVTLNLYPEGNSSGDTYWTATALVTGISNEASGDNMVSAKFSWTANGAVTETTVA